MLSVPMLILLCFLVFLAGFIDSVAGGGGLISLPAYIFVGLPAHNAMATNKFSSAVGTTISFSRFLKNKVMDVKVASLSAIGSFVAAFIASKIVLLIDEKVFKTMIVVVLPIAAVIIFLERDFGNENKIATIPKEKIVFLSVIIGLLMGFYDGLIGPGTGTFAIMAYCIIMKYDLKTASGNAKLLNLASNYASLGVFLFSGKILFHIAIPAAVAAVLGNYLGSGFAIKKGSKFIRPVMIFVMVLLFGKIFFDIFGSFFIIKIYNILN